MKIDIDSGSGFCFGVRNAVEIAEKALGNGEMVYCLGAIVHNDLEVERLQKKGLIAIGMEEFSALRDAKVLIRAHGEPPSTYETARANNITLIDATCPIVKRIQKKIRSNWQETKSKGGQIVLYGKKDHAEVIGLLGQTSDEAILVTNEEDINKIDFTQPVYLYSQTTMSIAGYLRLEGIIRARLAENRQQPGITNMLTVHNTICRHVANREPWLKQFAATHDVVIFVSGKDSSNGHMLFEVCHNINPSSYMIVSPHELRREWFDRKGSVGVCGATSTPKWLINKVAGAIEKMS